MAVQGFLVPLVVGSNPTLPANLQEQPNKHMTILTNASKTPENKKDLWQTNSRVLYNIERVLGVSFTFDACASPGAQRCDRFFSPADDALKQQWPNEPSDLIWCNPPFSLKREFVSKACQESARGARVVMCLPTDLTQPYWQEIHKHASLVLVPDKRINFVNEHGVLTKGVNFQTVFPVFANRHLLTGRGNLTCEYIIDPRLTEGL